MAGYSCPVKKQNYADKHEALRKSFSVCIVLEINALHTFAVNEHISIKSISEKNYILLIFKIDVCPCEEMRKKAERTEYSC